MAEFERVVCASEEVQERGKSVKFPIPEFGERKNGFVVRYNGRIYGYVNQCAHVPVELDWNEGDFFDITNQFLICATHGAQYNPETGYCVLGPCKGKRLMPLKMKEHDGKIYLYLN